MLGFLLFAAALDAPKTVEKFPIDQANDPFASYVAGCTFQRVLEPVDRKEDRATIALCSTKSKNGKNGHSAFIRFYHVYRDSDWKDYYQVTGYGGKVFQTDFSRSVITCHGDDFFGHCLYSETANITLSRADFAECTISGLTLKVHAGRSKILEFSAEECQSMAAWMKLPAPKK